MYNKQDIVAEARKWLGTNFHHQGRIKKCSTNKGGCDCIGLVIGIIRDLELPSTFKRKNGETIPLYDFDYTNYSAQPSGAKMLELIGQHFTPIDISDAVCNMIPSKNDLVYKQSIKQFLMLCKEIESSKAA